MTSEQRGDGIERPAGQAAAPVADPEPGPTPMRGVWVAVAIIGGAALVVLVLALTSGAIG